MLLKHKGKLLCKVRRVIKQGPNTFNLNSVSNVRNVETMKSFLKFQSLTFMVTFKYDQYMMIEKPLILGV